MKKLIIFISGLAIMSMLLFSSAMAQGRHGKGHYKHHKKYYKEYSKAHKKYYKERDDDWDDWDDDRHEGRRYYRHSDERWAGPPPWAPAHGYRAKHHVYFRDYYTFYDPYRGGYIYRHSDRWIFSRSVPSFLAHVDLGRARIRVMADIPLTKHPEYYFDRYAQRYPRDSRLSVNISLPSPF